MSAFIYDGIRTPIGRYAGALSSIRADDLAALPIQELKKRNPSVNWADLDDIILGCANQAGEDNRNVARMAGLLAGLPHEVGGITVNRLCASGLDAVGFAARAIKSGDGDFYVAGGVESMSRAPFVMPKAETPYSRANNVYDTTIGWRFVNQKMKDSFGIDSMPETADNVAIDYDILRDDQDKFAYRSQQKWLNAYNSGVFNDEIFPVEVRQKHGEPIVVDTDEHPRPETKQERYAQFSSINGENCSVTAANASGVNDGAAALLLGGQSIGQRFGLTPKAKVLGMVSSGVLPRVMGIGPISASQKVLEKHQLSISDLDIIELNEAFASQSLAVLRGLGIADDDERVNPNGGAIAMGHPLGMSGTRLVLTATNELIRRKGRYALCTMCVGVGQGVAMLIERVEE